MTDDTPSGAPMTKRRVECRGSNGAAVETTPRMRARISATDVASWRARSVGTTPLGVFRNNGSPSSVRRRPRPMADRGWRKMQPLRRPADMPLLKHNLEQHQQVEIDPGKINLVQHNAEIISLDIRFLKWDLDGIAGSIAGPTRMERYRKCSNQTVGRRLALKAALAMPLVGQRRTGADADSFGAGSLPIWSGRPRPGLRLSCAATWTNGLDLTRIAEDFTVMQPFGGAASRGFDMSTPAAGAARQLFQKRRRQSRTGPILRVRRSGRPSRDRT